jgi:hypothetical protein
MMHTKVAGYIRLRIIISRRGQTPEQTLLAFSKMLTCLSAAAGEAA